MSHLIFHVAHLLRCIHPFALVHLCAVRTQDLVRTSAGAKISVALGDSHRDFDPHSSTLCRTNSLTALLAVWMP